MEPTGSCPGPARLVIAKWRELPPRILEMTRVHGVGNGMSYLPGTEQALAPLSTTFCRFGFRHDCHGCLDEVWNGRPGVFVTKQVERLTSSTCNSSESSSSLYAEASSFISENN